MCPTHIGNIIGINSLKMYKTINDLYFEPNNRYFKIFAECESFVYLFNSSRYREDGTSSMSKYKTIKKPIIKYKILL